MTLRRSLASAVYATVAATGFCAQPSAPTAGDNLNLRYANGIVAVAEDNSAPDTLRGYAMYVLANLALAKGDSATAAKWVNLMDKRLKPNHVWASDKSWLVRSEPSLLTPVSVPPALPAGK